MKRLVLGMAVFAIFWSGLAEEARAKKVLMIGNSFSVCMLKEGPGVALAAGVQLDICSLYIGGCTLKRHWENIEAATNAAFRPYHVKANWAFGEMPAFPKEANIPEILKMVEWDVVTLQQGSHESWQLKSYSPYLADIGRCVKKYAPRAEIVLQETWSYTPFDKRLAGWKITPHEMYLKLHAAYYDRAFANCWRVIPMGTAVELFRERYPVVPCEDSFGGDPCGAATFTRDSQTGKIVIKGDVFHLNERGRYLQALVWIGKLFGVDPRTINHAPSYIRKNPAYFAALKDAAADALKGITPKGVASPQLEKDIARIRMAGVEQGEIGEIAWVDNAVKISFVLRPSPQSYIRCGLCLPAKERWDGRFWGLGNGGWAGSCGAWGKGNAATLSCDLGTSRYRIDENPVPAEILKDFGWRATHLATVQAKRLIRAYYGKDAVHCYFKGSSTGGGQGFCEIQRFPEDYEGVIAGVPAVNRIARATEMINLRRLEKKYGTSFSKEEQNQIREMTRAYFAKTDPAWVKGRCIFDPRPTPEKLSGCWQAVVTRYPALAPKEAFWKELFEPLKVKGRALVPGPMIGTEFSPSWTFMLEKRTGPRKEADITDDEILAFAEDKDIQFNDADLSAFAKRGGKLIFYAGLADSSVPCAAVTDYYEKVIAKMGGKDVVHKFCRYWLIPGRTHCPGGCQKPDSHPHEFLGDPANVDEVLQDWCEKGVAPDRLNFYELPARKVTHRLLPM